MSGALLMLVPLLPLALAVACLHARSASGAQRLAPWSVLPALAVLLLPDIETAVPGLLLDARMLLDDTARVFLGLSALLWGAAALYARGAMADQPGRARFHAFFLAAMAGNFGLIVAGDALGFYLWFTLMSLSAYGLVIHDGSDYARRAGRVYMALVVLGEVLLFAGLVLHAAAAGSVGFAAMAAAPMEAPAALLLLAAFGIKAGAMPLHVWLPLAHPAAPIPASAVLSGAMIKAGLLGWLRFLPPEQGLPGDWGAIIAWAGLGSAFLGVVLGLAQTRAKTVLAYSSISQMGFMLLGLGVAWSAPEIAPSMIAAVMLYALHHGLAKGALFLGVGVVQGSVHRGFWLWLGLALPALALSGLPLSSGAAAKYALKAPLQDLPWAAGLLMLLPLAALGTTLLLGRYLWLLRQAPPPKASAGPAMRAAFFGLVLAGPLMAWLWQPAREAGLSAISPAALLAALWPVLLGAVIAAVLAVHPLRRWPAVPEGDLWPLGERLLRPLMRLRPPRVDPMQWWQRAGAGLLAGLATLSRLEPRLAREPLPGALMLLLMLLVFWLLRG